MPFQKGNQGRPKGAKNKTTIAFKQAVMDVFAGMGGNKTFQKWAVANPTEFYKIAARLIPSEVTGGDPDQPVQHRVIFGGRYKVDGSSS